MDNATFSHFFLFCILRVFIYSLRLPRIFVLEVSRKLPKSAPLTIPTADLLILDKRGPLGLFPIHDFPLEICTHRSQISANGN